MERDGVHELQLLLDLVDVARVAQHRRVDLLERDVRLPAGLLEGRAGNDRESALAEPKAEREVLGLEHQVRGHGDRGRGGRGVAAIAAARAGRSVARRPQLLERGLELAARTDGVGEELLGELVYLLLRELRVLESGRAVDVVLADRRADGRGHAVALGLGRERLAVHALHAGGRAHDESSHTPALGRAIPTEGRRRGLHTL